MRSVGGRSARVRSTPVNRGSKVADRGFDRLAETLLVAIVGDDQRAEVGQPVGEDGLPTSSKSGDRSAEGDCAS